MQQSITISSSILSGQIIPPSSKSYAQRTAIAALLNEGETTIYNYGNSNDELATMQVIQAFGANIVFEKGKLIINSLFSKVEVPNEINVGESGLLLRLITPIAALFDKEITITGEGSLLNRPNHFFNEVMPQLGVDFKSNNGKLPFKIKGKLQLQNIEIDGSLSSQFLSGLVFAFSYLYRKNNVAEPINIYVNNLNSKPYIDVTLELMNQFDFVIPNNKFYTEFAFNNQRKQNYNVEYSIESDWSSVATMLVASAIAGNINILKTSVSSKQADVKIYDVLHNCGCVVMKFPKYISLTKPNTLKAFEFDATDCPDLIPILAALAVHCNDMCKIEGINRLQHKESNRGVVLEQEFKKLGVEIFIDDDVMYIKPQPKLIAAILDTHNDHRIAMACTLVALKSTETITITGVECVAKSYKNFYEDLVKLGAKIEFN